jgi:hypothetical protein
MRTEFVGPSVGAELARDGALGGPFTESGNHGAAAIWGGVFLFIVEEVGR